VKEMMTAGNAHLKSERLQQVAKFVEVPTLFVPKIA
jgi:hypothetical protein